MDLLIDFPGGARVDAHFDGLTVATDQPHADGSAPAAATPYATFLASIGTCAGIYVLGFCRQRGLDTTGLRLVQTVERDAAGHAARIRLSIQLPPGFPEKYRAAVIRAADQCLVKKQLEEPPEIVVEAVTGEPAAG
jgi:ribosomal protein S12 methylthiotransferase accessory factor